MNEIEDEELEVTEKGGGIAFSENNAQLDDLYDKFNERFPVETLKSLTLEEYTNLSKDNEDYFCTWVERKMQRLGSIQGATSLKFGIYRYNQDPKMDCKKDDQYAWRTDLGDTREEAFENVRNKIFQVAEAANGDEIDFKAIDECNLSTMFKWKIAFLYSKRRLLSVYSKDSLRFIAQERGMVLTKNEPISKIQQYLLSKQDCENRWDYTKNLWKQWDDRRTDAYNDFPVERWLSLFGEEQVFKPGNLDILKMFLDFGGEATFSQLAEKNGKSADHYRQICVKLAGRIADRLALTLEKSTDGEETRWKILFDGREVDPSSNIPGGFIWTLKPNLKIAMEQYFAEGDGRQYFVAKITDATKVYEESVRNCHWRMQQRYDHEEHKNAVTTNLTNAMLVKKGDVLLLDKGGELYAYGIVKAAPQNPVGIVSLKDVIDKHKHQYFENEGTVCFNDCEAYYERNYSGCKSDWSQYIDVECWKSYCPNDPVSNYGVQKAAGLSVHSIFPVKADWAESKIRELEEHFESSRTETDRMINEATRLLEMKKNVILQGAPGTGKTYATAALALSVLGISDVNLNDHEAVMERYNSLLIKFDDDGSIKNDGQIGFVTFHQSMDYEDFVEGIKPEIDDDDDTKVVYKVQPGMFKSICEKAKITKSNNFEAAYKTFSEYLKTNNYIGNTNYFGLKTPQNADYGVSLNRKGNITLWTGKSGAQLHCQGTLTKEKMVKQLQGVVAAGGWEGYYEGVLSELKLHYGLVQKSRNDSEKCVLIIDEINRGNVSKIFGELISLLEVDKRVLVGSDDNSTNKKKQHTIELILPYSKEQFSVPSNLYIIGTMNTTDRSVGSIDYAVRRRFAFFTLKASESALESYYAGKNNDDVRVEAINRFNKTSAFIEANKSTADIKFDDLMVGHSYFMAETPEDLELKWKYEVLPLLEEYKKDGLLKHSAKIEDVLA